MIQSITERKNKIGCSAFIKPAETAKAVKITVAVRKIKFKPYRIPSGRCRLIEQYNQ